MPGVTYEATLTNTGSSILGGSRVYFVAWEVTIQGPSVRHPNDWDLSTLVGVGHWELGNDLTPGGLISGVGWGDSHWLNSEIGQWVVTPGQSGIDLTAAIEQYIRWTISPGTEVHLYVFGDT